jgi:hypothetical protein
VLASPGKEHKGAAIAGGEEDPDATMNETVDPDLVVISTIGEITSPSSANIIQGDKLSSSVVQHGSFSNYAQSSVAASVGMPAAVGTALSASATINSVATTGEPSGPPPGTLYSVSPTEANRLALGLLDATEEWKEEKVNVNKAEAELRTAREASDKNAADSERERDAWRKDPTRLRAEVEPMRSRNPLTPGERLVYERKKSEVERQQGTRTSSWIRMGPPRESCLIGRRGCWTRRSSLA